MRAWITVTLAVALMTLGGCAVSPESGPVTAELPPAWQLTGRLAVANGRDGGSGQLQWRQLGPERAALRFHGALGQGSWRLDIEPGLARLALADGQVFVEADVDTLLRRHTALRIPVGPLQHWLLGRKAPGHTRGANHDDAGRLTALRQHGWFIEFQGYRAFGEVILPRKITAQRDGNEVRLIITAFEASAA